MKKVRSFSLTDEFQGVVQADAITHETRHAHKYRCLSETCNAAFHWRAGHRRDDNTRIFSATFARYAASAHQDNCPYDFENFVHRHKEIAFFQNGKFYLRVNFPLGADYTDLNPNRGRLTRAARETAENNTGKKSVRSMDDLVKLLEKEFGSLEHEALENLMLDYQGQSYAWPSLFLKGQDYGVLHKAFVAPTDKPQAHLVLVKPSHRIPSNAKGRPRFSCEAQTTMIDGHPVVVRPVIVCDSPDTVKKLEARQPMLVAARLFIRSEELKSNVISVYMHVPEDKQASPVKETYWKPAVFKQANFDTALGF